MKRSSFVLFACILVFVVSLIVAREQGDKGKKPAEVKQSTIEGEVVDVSCYLAHGDGGKGEGHKECGQACAKNGGPLGILTSDGKLYVSLLPDDHKNGPNALLINHVSHEVEATGVVRSKGGTHAIMISKVTMAGRDEPKEQKSE